MILPNVMVGEPPNEVAVKAKRWKCENCSAELAFDAALKKLKCSFCGHTQEVPQGEGAVVEHDLFEGLASMPKGLGSGAALRASRCQECGASVAFPEGVTATKCTFCGSSKVLEQEENQNALRPESLLPFSVDKKRAGEAFSTWLKKLWFRPNDLKALAKVHELAGVYVPFWTFDANVASRWTAEAGYYYYVEEEYTTQENGQTVVKTRRVQKTRWERAWGQRADHYDDVLVAASKGLPQDLAAKLRTF